MIYKCVNCGGNVVYDPDSEKMHCPYCDSKDCEEERYDHADMSVCPDCGGAMKVLEHTSALMCEYCNNYVILDERVENQYLPNRMIPFKLGKDKVKELMKNKFKRILFTPTDFLSEARLNQIQGTYVPFWMFDYDTDCSLDAVGIKIRVWTSGNTEYTEKSFYHVERNMNIDYQDIPVDASIAMPDPIMDLMEPYDYSAMIPFTKKLMSGFYGEKYNMEAGTIECRAREKMEASAQQILRNSVSGYNKLMNENKNISVRRTERRYDLLPVWKYDYSYQGENYPFYINGQTGKIVGKVPISIKKVMAYSATLWATLTAGLLMLGYIVSNL